MRHLLEQIKKGLDNNLYYLSLFAVLTLPDICGAMASENGKACRKKYIQWFDNYVGGKCVGSLNGEDCWYFRCSLLHQGSSQNPKSNYSRVLFVEPTATTNVLHCNILDDALNIDVRIFCNDVVEGVRGWLKEVEKTEPYKTNYSRFMMWHPHGLELYIKGVPVIG